MTPYKDIVRQWAKEWGVTYQTAKRSPQAEWYKKEYLEWKEKVKKDPSFNVFTNDPSCKTCRKKKLDSGGD